METTELKDIIRKQIESYLSEVGMIEEDEGDFASSSSESGDAAGSSTPTSKWNEPYTFKTSRGAANPLYDNVGDRVARGPANPIP